MSTTFNAGEKAIYLGKEVVELRSKISENLFLLKLKKNESGPPRMVHTSELSRCFTVRIQEGEVAREVNKFGAYPKDGFADTESSIAWHEAEANLKTLHFAPYNTHEPGGLWYAYIQNNVFVLVEPVK